LLSRDIKRYGRHPWFEFGFMAPADSDLAKRHPDWLSVAVTVARFGLKASTTEFGSTRPEVQQFIQDLILEIVSKYDIDGQFDDHFGYRLSWDTMPSQLGNICKNTRANVLPIIPKILNGCAGLTKLLSI